METVDVLLRPERVPAAADTGRIRAFLVREWLLVLVVAVFVSSSAVAAGSWLTSDGWFDFLYGREILAHGLPHHVTLTVLGHGRAWSDQQWLGQVALYGVFAAGGAKLAALVTVALFASSLALAIALARRRGASALGIGAVVLLAWLYLSTWIQTEAFSHLAFVVVLGLLAAESRRRTRRVWLVFPILVVWANVHGAVVLAAGLTALLGGMELVQRLRSTAADRPGLARPLALLLAPWLCLVATPYGFDVIGYYRSTIFNSAFHDYLGPWMPPLPFSWIGGPFVALAFLATALVARRWRRLTPFEVAVLAVTAVGGLEAERSIMWFALAAIVLLPALIETERDRSWRDPSPRLRLLTVAVACTVAAATVGQALARPESYYQRQYPPAGGAAIARYLERHPGARVFGTDHFGDWLVYTHPALWGRVGYDADWEQLTQTQVRDVVFFLRQFGADWERPTLGFRLLVISPKEQPWLVETYDRRRDVRAIYRAPDAVVFERIRPR